MALLLGASAVVLPLPAVASERAMEVDTVVPLPVTATAEAGQAPPLPRFGQVDVSPFRMLGASWTGEETDAARVRVRTGGTWGPWTELEADEDEGPDQTSPEYRHDRLVTRPVWVGTADGYELEAPPSDLKVHLVRPSGSTIRLAPGGTARASSGPSVLDRGAWGASAPRGEIGTARAVKMGFVHHTVNANNYAAGDVPSLLRGMQAYHMNTNGWNDIGYNFLVDRFGRTWEGRWGSIDRAVVGAHTQGFNTGSTGVAVIGTFSSAGPAPAAVDNVARVMGWKLGHSGVDPEGSATMTSGGNHRYPAGATVTFAAVSGHRDGKATDCPGQLLYDQLPNIRRSARHYAGVYAEPPPPPPDHSAVGRIDGDYNGDKKEDVAAFYNYGSGHTGLFIWYANAAGSGFEAPVLTWSSGLGKWTWEATKAVAGDFNGDGRDDVGAFYDHGGGVTGLFTFSFDAGGAVTVARPWLGCPNCFDWERIKQVAGDFNGDQRDDVGAFYNYGGGTTGLFTFSFDSAGGVLAARPFVSCSGCFEWERIKQVSGNFNGDRRDDVGAFYNYGGGTTGLFTFSFDAGGGVVAARPFLSCPGCFDWNRSKQIAGDFNGDQRDDVGAFYNYGGGVTGLFTFSFDAGGGVVAARNWLSCPNCWDWNRTQQLAGDFNGDGKQDVGAFYNYGGGVTGLFTFSFDVGGGVVAARPFVSCSGCWQWDNAKLT